MSEPRLKCPICGRDMEVILERRSSLVCLCPEHGRFYLCRVCGYATRSRRGIAGHVKLHRRVEITGGNNEAPQGGASKSLEIPRNSSKPLETPRNTSKSVEILSNPSKSLENSRNTLKPLETTGNPSKQLEIPRCSSKPVEKSESPAEPLEAPGGPEAGGTLDPEQLADGLLEGKVSIQELGVLTERQLLLVVATLLVRLSYQPRGRVAEPARGEQAQPELPSFVKDNPWLDVLRGRKREA